MYQTWKGTCLTLSIEPKFLFTFHICTFIHITFTAVLYPVMCQALNLFVEEVEHDCSFKKIFL